MTSGNVVPSAFCRNAAAPQAKYYGFTEEELDFIINYDIKYRMGDELNAGK